MFPGEAEHTDTAFLFQLSYYKQGFFFHGLFSDTF